MKSACINLHLIAFDMLYFNLCYIIYVLLITLHNKIKFIRKLNMLKIIKNTYLLKSHKLF